MNEDNMNENKIIEVTEVKEEGNKSKERHSEDKHYGIGKIVGKIFKLIGKIIKKGNENYFEIKKENEDPIRISLTISVLLLMFLSLPTIVLLVVGLFCGYQYSLTGSTNNYNKVNEVFGKATEAADNFKEDFKKEYNK
nr:DUF4342 domain-containing protein [uncultured Clostridium sp.]